MEARHWEAGVSLSGWEELGLRRGWPPPAAEWKLSFLWVWYTERKDCPTQASSRI